MAEIASKASKGANDVKKESGASTAAVKKEDPEMASMTSKTAGVKQQQ